MSAYPSTQDNSQAGQGFSNSSMFSSGQQAQPESPARQLLADVAPITQALAQLGQAHPELQQTIMQIGEVLKQGLNDAISQMQVPANGDGGQPAYG